MIFVPQSDSGGISPLRRMGRRLFNICWNWSRKLWKHWRNGLARKFSLVKVSFFFFFSNIFDELLIREGTFYRIERNLHALIYFFFKFILELESYYLPGLYHSAKRFITPFDSVVGKNDRRFWSIRWKMNTPTILRSIC